MDNPLAGSRSFEAVVFDLDGTLVEIPVDWNEVRSELSKIAGVPLDGVSLFPKIGQIFSQRPAMRTRFFSLLDSREMAAVGRTIAAPGAIELVKRASSSKRLGLVTLQGRKTCARILDRFDIARCFSKVLSREDALDRASQLRMAADGLRTSPSRLLFVGDKQSDAVAGREVGATVALVGGRALPEWGSDYVFPKIADLGKLI